MQIHIRRSDCCGHGECAAIAPDVFAIDSRNKAIVLDPEAASVDLLIEAAEACPCQAVVVQDDEGNEVFP